MKYFLLPALFLLFGCNEKIPKGYYHAIVSAKACTSMIQVRGEGALKDLNEFDYIHIDNLPSDLQHVGASFYFKSYEDTDFPVCLTSTVGPQKSILVFEITTKKP